jgi:hypothetical protein
MLPDDGQVKNLVILFCFEEILLKAFPHLATPYAQLCLCSDKYGPFCKYILLPEKRLELLNKTNRMIKH